MLDNVVWNNGNCATSFARGASAGLLMVGTGLAVTKLALNWTAKTFINPRQKVFTLKKDY
jgi:hypothetical protein